MSDTESLVQLRTFVANLRDRYARYHAEKESMAYAAFAAYLVAYVTALVSGGWPPKWAQSVPVLRFGLATFAATALWLVALWFIGWQLIRRRLAAVRVAAAERLLTRWLTIEPRVEEAQPWMRDPKEREPPGLWWHVLWPPAAPIPEGDVKDAQFPAVLVTTWRSQELWPGTAARNHEKGLVIVGWFLWLALLVKTAIVSFL